MPPNENGNRRPIQFYVSMLAIGGLVMVTLGVVGGLMIMGITGVEEASVLDTIQNAALLLIGGLVSLASTVGGWLYGRGAQGEPISPPAVTVTPSPVAGVGPTTHVGGS